MFDHLYTEALSFREKINDIRKEYKYLLKGHKKTAGSSNRVEKDYEKLPLKDLYKILFEESKGPQPKIKLHKNEREEILEVFRRKSDEYEARVINDLFSAEKGISYERINNFVKEYNDSLQFYEEFLKKYTEKRICQLEQRHNEFKYKPFLEVKAHNHATGEVGEETTETEGFLLEKAIQQIIRGNPRRYLPNFKNWKEDDTIELLYAKNMFKFYETSYESPKAILISRVKASKREREKVVDWFTGVRKDLAYDTQGMQNIVSLEDIYIALEETNMLSEESEKKPFIVDYKGPLTKDMSLKQLRNMVKEMQKMDKAIRNRKRPPTEEEREFLKAGIWIDHYVEKGRFETIIQSPEMYEIMNNGALRHDTDYIRRRNEQRKKDHLKNHSLLLAETLEEVLEPMNAIKRDSRIY